MSAKRASAPEQYVSINCECGKKCGQYLTHYEIVMCDCYRKYWALQPQRGGPLVLKPWPGPYIPERYQQPVS